MNTGDRHDKLDRRDVKAETSASTARQITVVDGRIDSGLLFGASRQITIEHGANAYILRVTAQNKLILTK
jgi:hemin uptake protein HemP